MAEDDRRVGRRVSALLAAAVTLLAVAGPPHLASATQLHHRLVDSTDKSLPFKCRILAQRLQSGHLSIGATAGLRGTVPADRECPGVLWAPSAESPLPVKYVVNFTEPADAGGMNAAVHSLAWAVKKGCDYAQKRQAKMITGEEGTHFVMVVLPPIQGARAPTDKKATMHEFSDLFDLESVTEVYRKDRNCFVTDQPTYDQMSEAGLINLDPKHLRVMDDWGRMDEPETGIEQMRLFSVLQMSQHLKKEIFFPCLKKVQRQFGISANSHNFMAVHTRVEDSWMDRYCKHMDDEHHRKLLNAIHLPGEEKGYRRACFGADEVANITLNTKNLKDFENVLMLYDADHFMAADHTRKTRYKVDPMTVWPESMTVASTYHLGCFHAKDSFTERGVATMFMANWADAFVGPMLSSDDVTISKFRQHGGHHVETFFYDCPKTNYKNAVHMHNWHKC